MIILNRFYGYLKKDFFLIYRRKKFLYLFFGIPLLLAFLFNLFLNPFSYKINAGVCDLDKTSSSYNLLRADSINFKVFNEENCTVILKKKILSRDIDFGIVIPKGFQEDLKNLRQANIKIIYDNTDISFSNLISWKVDVELYYFKIKVIDEINNNLKKDISTLEKGYSFFKDFIPSYLRDEQKNFEKDLQNIKSLDTNFILNPVLTYKEPIYQEDIKEKAGIVYVFPIISLITILMLSSTSIIYDRKNGFITRVKSNSYGFSYLIAKTLFFVFLTFIQFLIIFSVFFFNGYSYQLNLNYIVLIFSIGLLNSLLGFLIGFISENEGVAVLFSLIISFPLMLVSGIFYPTQTLPKIVQYFSYINPLSYEIYLSKSVILFNSSIDSLWIYFSLIIFSVCFWFLKKKR
ncbi:MAG: ABC transporter permease [Candidatus Pacearchaeota archaeon]